jgi:hypothetical protein
MATRSGLRSRERAPTTSGSEIESGHSNGALSDEEIVEIQQKVSGRPIRDRKPVKAFNPSSTTYNSAKSSTTRKRRPIKWVSGEIFSVEELKRKADDALQKHRPTCTICSNSPVHEILLKYGIKDKDDFINMGGWLQVCSTKFPHLAH